MVPIMPIRRSQTLKEMAYEQVRGLLRSGQMRSDMIYSANQLADLLGVSRTPVREALLQLSSEGFLTALDSKGFRVQRFTRKEMEDTFEARAAIEGYAVAKLAEHSEGGVPALDGAIERMTAAAAAGDTPAFMEADEAFHLHFVHALDNRVLTSMMEKIRDHILVLGHRAVAAPGRMKEVIAEHQQIADALRNGDRLEASRALKRHLELTAKRLAAGTFAKDGRAQTEPDISESPIGRPEADTIIGR